MKKLFVLKALILILVICGCKKEFLINPPLNEITAASFWKTEADALLGLNAVYDALQIDRGYRLGAIMLGDIAADDMTCFDTEWFVKLDQFTFNSNEDQLLGSWRAWYSGISRANSVLKYVPDIEMNTEIRDRIVNEAKFLRGVCYFNIVNIWGAAPLITSELSNEQLLSLKREPVESIWSQIEQDFTDAEALPLKYGDADLGRATKGAAKAFLARSFLYQKKFQQAADKAKEVIDLGVYDLFDEYIENYQTASENGIESIFEVQFVPGTGGWGNNEGNWLVSYSAPGGVPEYVPSGGWGIIVPEATAGQAYEAGDKRRKVNLFESGSVYNNVPYDPAWSPSGVNFAKYIIGDPPSDKDAIIDAERNTPVIRYSEVLLIYAEALNEIDQTGNAFPYLNIVRERAGLPDLSGLSKDAFRDAILQERRIEFFGEGQRFFDLRRMGKSNEFIKVKAGKVNYSEPKNLYFPLPQTDLDLNSNLTQNPDY